MKYIFVNQKKFKKKFKNFNIKKLAKITIFNFKQTRLTIAYAIEFQKYAINTS